MAEFIKIGTQFRIIDIVGDSVLTSRLQEIGLKKGMLISYFTKAPFGGPSIYRVGTTMFALRQEEKKCLILEKI